MSKVPPSPWRSRERPPPARSFLFLIYVSTWTFPCGPSASCCLAAWNLLRGQCTERQRHDLNITNFMTFVLCSYHHENEIKKKNLSTQNGAPNLASSVCCSCCCAGGRFSPTVMREHVTTLSLWGASFLLFASQLVFSACFPPTNMLFTWG